MSSSTPNGEKTVEVSSWDADTLVHYQKESLKGSSSAMIPVVVDQCLQCNIQFNSTNFKKVADSCGHIKCLNCVIKSCTDGCKQCIFKPTEEDSNCTDPTNLSIPTPCSNISSSKDAAFGSHVSQVSVAITSSEHDSRKSSRSSSSVPETTASLKAKPKRLSVFEVLTSRKLARLQQSRDLVYPTPEQTSKAAGEKIKIRKNSSADNSWSIIKEVEHGGPRRSSRLKKPFETAPKQSSDQNQSALQQTMRMYPKKGSGESSSTHRRKQILICEVCDKRFDFPYSLRRHLVAIHADIRAYRCMMKCKNVAFARWPGLLRHVELKHNKTRIVASRLVDKVAMEYLKPYHSLDTKLEHSKLHELVETTVIQRTNLAHMLQDGSQHSSNFDEGNEFDKKTEKTEPDKSIPTLIPVTPVAGTSFPPKSSCVTKHKLRESLEVESDDVQASAPIPGVLKTKSSTRVNRLGRRRKRVQKCNECNSRFPDINKFNRHRMRHMDTYPYNCNNCTKSFKLHDALVEHLKHVHNFQSTVALKVAKEVAAKYLIRMRVYKAPEEIDFSRIHAAVVETVISQPKTTVMTVGQSNARGNDDMNFRNSTRPIPSRPVTMDSANKGKSSLKRKRNNSNVKKTAKTWNTPRNKKKISFVCKICKKGFKRLHELQYHSFNHTKKRPFSCSTCKKGCRNIGDLKRHLWTHTVSRPLKCSICKVTKRTKWEVVYHMQVKHASSKEVAVNLANDAIVRYLKEVEMIDLPEDIPFSMINDIVLCIVLKNENVAIPEGIFQNNEVFMYAQNSKRGLSRTASSDLSSESRKMSSLCTRSSTSNVNPSANQEDILIDKDTYQNDQAIDEDMDDEDYVPDSNGEEGDEEEEIDD